MTRPRRRFDSFWIALGLFIALAYTTTDLALSAPNERSRLYLSVALYEHQSFRIDAVRAQFGPVLDEAYFAGHYFTDKAPGSSLLGFVAYACLRLFLDASEVTLPMLLELGRYGVMVPIGVASFFAFTRLAAALRIGRAATRWAACAYLLATPAFHYSAAFFGHQIVALGLLLAMLLVVGRAKGQRRLGAAPYLASGSSLDEGESTPGTCSSWLASGALTGMSVLTEYQALLGALGIVALVVVPRQQRWRRLAWFGLGGLPFAIFFAFYHARCFGSPFELSYHHLSNPTLASVHRQGLGGVTYPTLEGLWGTLLSHHRGLLATSPFTVLAVRGVYRLWRRGPRGPCLILAWMLAGQLVFVAASATWEAGWGFGPRLLVPVLPIVCAFVAAALDREQEGAASPWLWGLANSGLLVGVSSFQAMTAVFAEPPNDLKNPWLDVILPLVSHATPAPNLGSQLLGLEGWWSLVPLVLVYAALGIHMARELPHRRAIRPSLGFVAATGLVFPVILALSVLASGPSVSAAERGRFVSFVQQLRRG